MALQLGALRDALEEAGASPEKSAKAAEELAGYERQFADIRGDLKLVKWMAGASIGLTLLILGSVVTLLAKVGELGGQLTEITRTLPH